MQTRMHSLKTRLGTTLLAAAGIYACSSDAPERIASSDSEALLWNLAKSVQNDPANTAFDILTQHNDNARSGTTKNETLLTPTNVKKSFGLIATVPVDGIIYAQPLYVEKAAVMCGGVVQNANIAFVVTLANMIYAIDVDKHTVCWSRWTGGTGEDATPILGFDPAAEGAGKTKVGIVSTPVIDTDNSVMYVVAREYSVAAKAASFYLYVVDTGTGHIKHRQLVANDGKQGCNGKAFNADVQTNRPGLLRVSTSTAHKLYLGFGSAKGENGPKAADYRGWVLGFDITNPNAPVAMNQAFCSTPLDAKGGPEFGAGVWMSGAGLASDGLHIYFTTGNGAYPFASGTTNVDVTKIHNSPRAGEYPDSFVAVDQGLVTASGYTDDRPQSAFGSQYDFQGRTIFGARERGDADLGSGGVLLVNGFLIGGGKDGRLYSLQGGALNKFSMKQSFQAFFDGDRNADSGGNPDYGYRTTYAFDSEFYAGPNIHNGLVAWDVSARIPNHVYVYGWAEKETLKRFSFNTSTGLFDDAIDAGDTLAQLAQSTETRIPSPSSAHGSVMSPLRSMPGGMISVSSNGANDGIVWGVVEEPYPTTRGSDNGRGENRCGTQPPSADCPNCNSDCDGCALTGGKFAEYCDGTQGYVAGRLYAFAADDDGHGYLPILWGDRRSGSPNNAIPGYSKFTPPTIAHGKVLVPGNNNPVTAKSELRIYSLNPVAKPKPPVRPVDDLVVGWNDANNTVTWGLYASTGAGTFQPATSWAPQDGGWGASPILAGDFDGDGKTDVAALWSDVTGRYITVRRSTGTTWSTSTWRHSGGTWTDATNAQWLAGDFDGDGRSDLVEARNDGGLCTFTVWQSAGTHFMAPVQWLTQNGDWGFDQRWVAGDFNGDALTDIAAVWNNAGTNNVTVRLSTRQSFRLGKTWSTQGGWEPSTVWLGGDFDQDGRSDLMAVWNSGGSVAFGLFSSQGGGFANPFPWNNLGGGWIDAPAVKWQAGDFDGDGRTDVVSVWNNAGNTMTIRTANATTSWQSHDGWLDSSIWLAGHFR